MSRATDELLTQAHNRANELVDNFSLKNLALENKYKSQLLNSINEAKEILLQEVKESIRSLATTEKPPVQSEDESSAMIMKRLDGQYKIFKQSFNTKLEPTFKELKNHLRTDGVLKKFFETNMGDSEMNELNEIVKKLSPKVSVVTTTDLNSDELDKIAKESILIRNAINDFESKSKAIIDGLRASLKKNMLDFQNEIANLKSEFDIEDTKMESVKFDERLVKLKQLLKQDYDKQLRLIIDHLIQINHHSNLTHKFDRQLTELKYEYLKKLQKSDSTLSVQYLEHVKWMRKRLWLFFNSLLVDLVDSLTQSVEQSKSFKDDSTALKQVNEVVEKTIKNYDFHLDKSIDQSLDELSKKLRQFNCKPFFETVETQVNKEIANKFVQSIESASKRI